MGHFWCKTTKIQKFHKTCSLSFSKTLLDNFDYSMSHSRDGGHGCNIPLKGQKIVKRGANFNEIGT